LLVTTFLVHCFLLFNPTSKSRMDSPETPI